MSREWIRVSKSAPCPICEKPDWCSMSSDGKAVRCMRAQNERRSKGRDGQVGWIWTLDDPIPDHVIQANKTKKVNRLSLDDIKTLHRKHFLHHEAEAARREIADKLNIRTAVLRSMEVGVGWTDRGEQYTSWPSRSAEGKVIGIIRRFASGKKLTYPGTSNAGVFTSAFWWIPMGPVFIVEGGSDTAALTDANLCVIGRPSNTGGAQVIAEMIARRRTKSECFVVTEMDEKDESNIPKRLNHPPECPGCHLCWPGYSGALAVAKQLEDVSRGSLTASVVFPPRGFKDVQAAWAIRRDLIEAWLDEQGILGKTGFLSPI